MLRMSISSAIEHVRRLVNVTLVKPEGTGIS